MKNHNTLIGLTVFTLRKRSDVSIESLSYEIDIEKKHLWLIEKGKTNITMKTLSKICTYFDISYVEFFELLEEINS